MLNDVIIVSHLKKSYTKKNNIFGFEKEKTIALDDISFEVKKGEIFGILGPNGAGKSTLIKIMSTLLKEDFGKVTIFENGKELLKEKEIRKKINIISGSERGLYWRLTAKENLEYFAELYGVIGRKKKEKIEELLKLVELYGREEEKVEKYSKGMKQRLQIARGLINDPDILFLDEPTLGLDVLGAKKLRELIKRLSLLGKTIIFTTHYMNEAEEICDRILFINQGKIVKMGKLNDLKRELMDKKKVKIIFRNNLKIEEKLFEYKEIENLKIKDNTIEFLYKNDWTKINSIIKMIVDLKEIDSFEVRNSTLEELYINIIGGRKNE